MQGKKKRKGPGMVNLLGNWEEPTFWGTGGKKKGAVGWRNFFGLHRISHCQIWTDNKEANKGNGPPKERVTTLEKREKETRRIKA